MLSPRRCVASVRAFRLLACFALASGCSRIPPDPAPRPSAPLASDAAPAAPTEGVTKVEYHFGDRSVPPPNHRSFTITVTAVKVTKIVDSYGDVVDRFERPATKEDLTKAMSAFTSAHLTARPKGSASAGCTGGTSESVTLHRGAESTFSGTVYHCAGADSGTLEGNVRAFEASLDALAK